MTSERERDREEFAEEREVKPESGGEYGIEQVLAPDEAGLSKAREKSEYHYSQEELQHKQDRIDRSE